MAALVTAQRPRLHVTPLDGCTDDCPIRHQRYSEVHSTSGMLFWLYSGFATATVLQHICLYLCFADHWLNAGRGEAKTSVRALFKQAREVDKRVRLLCY